MKSKSLKKRKNTKLFNKITRNNPGPFKMPKDENFNKKSNKKCSKKSSKKCSKKCSKKRPVGRPRGTTKNDIKLTNREQLFANLILDNLLKSRDKKMSNTDCFRLAYKNYKMSEPSAQVTASKLLKKPHIHAYIQQRKKAAAGRVEITTARVLKGLLRIAEFDPRKLLDKKGQPIPIHKLDKETALGMAGLEFERVSRRTPSGRRKIIYFPKKIKHEARKPAWELLGTHLNMFNGLNEQNTPEDFVNDVRNFADSVLSGLPGGSL